MRFSMLIKIGGILMKVITVLNDNDAKVFNEKKLLITTELRDSYNSEALEDIRNFVGFNTGYEDVPIIGISKINGNSVNLEKQFDEIPAFLPVASGDYILELNVNEDEAISLDYNEFAKFEHTFDEAMVASQRAKLNEEFCSRLTVGTIKDIANTLCFIPRIRVKDCRCYALLTEDWAQESVELAGIKPAKLNKLGAFKGC